MRRRLLRGYCKQYKATTGLQVAGSVQRMVVPPAGLHLCPGQVAQQGSLPLVPRLQAPEGRGCEGQGNPGRDPGGHSRQGREEEARARPPPRGSTGYGQEHTCEDQGRGPPARRGDYGLGAGPDPTSTTTTARTTTRSCYGCRSPTFHSQGGHGCGAYADRGRYQVL